MKKLTKIILRIFFLQLIVLNAIAQNLIVNPDLKDMNWCWYAASYSYKIKECDWPSYSLNDNKVFHNLKEFSNNTFKLATPGAGIYFGINGTSSYYSFQYDQFNREIAGIGGVYGFQVLPRNGNASIYMDFYDNSVNGFGQRSGDHIGTFVQGKLKNGLSKGCKYHFKLNITSVYDFQATTNSFGVSFLEDSVFFNDYSSLVKSLKPDIDNPRENWFKENTASIFEGDFVAKGNEKYFVFGNFHLDDSTRIHTPFFGMANNDSIFNYDCGYSISDFSLVLDSTLQQRIDLGNDIMLCKDSSISISAPGGFYNYRWNTGDSSKTIDVTKPGTYTITADYGCGTVQDSIKVFAFSDSGNLLIKENTYYKCIDDTIAIEARQGYTNYKWSNGDLKNKLTTQFEGKFFISAQSPLGCLVKDSVEIINLGRIQKVDLGNDTSLCSNKMLELTVIPGNDYVLWNTGSSTNKINVGAGVYKVTVYNKCYSQSDSISITAIDCSSIIVPNVFTPNNDGINEYFKIISDDKRPFNLKVFNRWGNIIYQNSTYFGDWNAENISDGIYFYELIDNEYSKTIRGNIQVLR